MKRRYLLLFAVLTLVLPNCVNAMNSDNKEMELSINISQGKLVDAPLFKAPVIVIVWCKWEKGKDRGTGSRTIYFLIIGFGKHKLEWQTWNDFDGDGNWDLWGPFPPNCREFGPFFPIHIFKDYTRWSGYTPLPSAKPKVYVKYWIDGRYYEKEFEPKKW